MAEKIAGVRGVKEEDRKRERGEEEEEELLLPLGIVLLIAAAASLRPPGGVRQSRSLNQRLRNLHLSGTSSSDRQREPLRRVLVLQQAMLTCGSRRSVWLWDDLEGSKRVCVWGGGKSLYA